MVLKSMISNFFRGLAPVVYILLETTSPGTYFEVYNLRAIMQLRATQVME